MKQLKLFVWLVLVSLPAFAHEQTVPAWHQYDGAVETPQPGPDHKHFSVMFKPLSRESNLEEAGWQTLNVIDTLQTIQLSRRPDCYNEVGQLAIFTGAHPSTKGAILGGIGFGVGHYVITRLIENLIDDNPDYRVIGRSWQAVSTIWKGAVVYNNFRIGLNVGGSSPDPNHCQR